MGKNKKKDPDKRAALQLKKEAKANKAAKKRLQKEAKNQGGPDEADVDELLEAYRQQDAQVETAVLEPLQDEFPRPRANATLTLAPDKNDYIYLFGGEYYDGVENIVLDELLRWDTKKGEWKRIVTPAPRPPPRCAHSTVYYRNALYVFGGEMATADHYQHYRDLWRFDLATLTWEEISGSAKGTSPSARSGHMTFMWKQYMIVFGGFYEALRDTRWHNDVCVMDLQSHTWLEMPYSKLATRPEPRSACNVGLFGDVALVHGGFCKLKNPTTKAESKVHTDCWMLHLKPILQGRHPTWERVSIRSNENTSTSFTPNSRSGTSSLPYKNRLLVFGGVIDREEYHHRIESVFYNELFAFDVERRKWFPLRAKPQSSDGKARRRRKKQQEDEKEAIECENDETDNEEDSDDSIGLDEEMTDGEAVASGWDLDMLRSNMFAFVDGDGNVVYEKIEEEDDEEEEPSKKSEAGDGYAADSGEVSEAVTQAAESEEEKEEEKEEEGDESETEPAETQMAAAGGFNKAPDHVAITRKYTLPSSTVMTMNKETGAPEPVARSEPLPRINAEMIIQGHTLVIYGGVLEVGDREVTLDDCWTFDLRKRDKWICVNEGTMHQQVWRGATFDDDDSYVSTGAAEDFDDSEDDISEAEPVGSDDIGEKVTEDQKAGAKKERQSKRSGLKQEIKDLKEKLDLDDANSTPQVSEAMADFYSRTSEYWNQQAASAVQESLQASGVGEPLSSKELKREGFNLARERYDELRPLLERLNELDLQQQHAEEERKTRKSDKEKKKKDKEKKKERRNR